MRKQFALWDRAFETPGERRLRLRQEEREREEQERLEAEHRAEIEREALAIKAELTALRFEYAQQQRAWEAECAEHKRRADIAWDRFKAAFMRGDFAARQKANFNPDQPRDELGKWTDGDHSAQEESDKVQLAASEGLPPIGPLRAARLAYQVAKRLIDAYRSENLLIDLFGEKPGAVSVTTIDGEHIFGTHRGSRLHDRDDERDWRNLRDALATKKPDLGSLDNLGRYPLNALTHAETNVLVRAARKFGGSLAGRELEVLTDREMCLSCDVILPHVVQELGSPTVTFIGPKGPARTIQNGQWKD
jgi:hypothetical protein